VEPLGHLIRDAIEQEGFRAQRNGASLPRAQQGAIEQNRRGALRHAISLSIATRIGNRRAA
jgi:hypothetical protein